MEDKRASERSGVHDDDWIVSCTPPIAPGSKVLLKDASGNAVATAVLCASAKNPKRFRDRLHGHSLRDLQRGARENERLVIIKMKKALVPPDAAEAPYPYTLPSSVEVPASVADMQRGAYYLWDLQRIVAASSSGGGVCCARICLEKRC